MPSDRHQPRQDRSRSMVDAIVQAAAELLVDQGPQTTTNHIARRAGVSVGSLYRYFPDKASLFLAVAEDYAARLQRVIQDASDELGDLPLSQAVPELVHRLMAVETSEPRVGSVLNRMRAEGWSCPPLDAFEADMETLASDFLRREGGPQDLSTALADLAGPVAVRAIAGVMRSTLIRNPEQLLQPGFSREITKLLLRFVHSDADGASGSD